MTHNDGRKLIARCALEFMTERELASRWRIFARTLQRWRAERYGPSHVLIGGSVRYRMADVHAFEEGRRSDGARS